jgi:5-methylcytosine-specific restriction endonuclease McrA
MHKECKRHGWAEFALRGDGSYRCKRCASESVTRRRKRMKARLVEYKGGHCQVCGYDCCIEAMDFHHLVPGEKDPGISVSRQTISYERAVAEVDKCILLCSNCHREVHAGLLTTTP